MPSTIDKETKETISHLIEVMKGYDASFNDTRKSAFERSNIAVDFFTKPCMRQVISLLEAMNQ